MRSAAPLQIRPTARLRGKPDWEDRQAEIAAAALHGSDLPLVVTDGSARVVLATPSAERAACAGTIAIDARGLRAILPDESRRLHAMIARVASGGAGGMLLLSGAEAAPFAVLVAPLPFARGEDGRLVLVTLRRLGTCHPDTADRLACLFGLTLAERGVLEGLLLGRSVEEISATRAVSLATVRAQIRQLLMKFGAGNLRDVVRIASSLG